MIFTANGTYQGDDYSVTWDDGVLSGTEWAIGLIQIMDDVLAGTDVGPVGGPYTIHDHVKDPVSAAFVIRYTLGEPNTWIGDIPERPSIPPHVIG